MQITLGKAALTNNQAADALTKIYLAIKGVSTCEDGCNYQFRVDSDKLKDSLHENPELFNCLKEWSHYWTDRASSDKAYTRPYEH